MGVHGAVHPSKKLEPTLRGASRMKGHLREFVLGKESLSGAYLIGLQQPVQFDTGQFLKRPE
jgi:hypothetical protein